MNQPKNILLDALRISIAGAIIGLALVKGLEEILEETDEKSSTATETLPTDINWATVGRSILAEKATGNQTLNEYLRQQYLGLYVIGRSGERLKDSEIESLCKDLHHFHRQLDREEDWGPAAWYETIGTSHAIPLSHRLGRCPEIMDLQVDDGYIAHALGEEVDGLEFGDFLFDFTELRNRGFLD